MLSFISSDSWIRVGEASGDRGSAMGCCRLGLGWRSSLTAIGDRCSESLASPPADLVGE